MVACTVYTQRFLVAVACVCMVGVSRADERIRINTQINGKPVRLALDTGAEGTVIFRHVAERLGLNVTDPPEGAVPKPGAVLAGRTEACQLGLLGPTEKVSLLVVDMPPFLVRDIDGVVSWNQIGDALFLIDADHKAVLGLTALPAEMTPWKRWHLNADSGLLALDVPGVPEGSGTIAIDTASPFGVELCPGQWETWRKEHPDQPSTLVARSSPATPIAVRVECWAKEVAIGGLSLHDVPVTQAAPEAGQMLRAHLATLGLFALTRLDIIVDRTAGTVYTREHSGATTVYQYNRLGAVFVPQDMGSQDLVAHVVQGGPASSAGIQDGDILLKIDDLDVTAWRSDPSVLPLSRFWSRPAGTSLQLVLKRNGELLQRTATLRAILDQGSPAATPPEHTGAPGAGPGGKP